MGRTRGLGRAIGRVVGRDRAADEDAGDVPERRRPTASARCRTRSIWVLGRFRRFHRSRVSSDGVL